MNEITMRDHCADNYGLDLTQLPKSQSEAAEIGSRYYFNGLVCPKGHVAARYTKGGRCTWCTRASAAARQGNEFSGTTPKALKNAVRKAAHENGDVTYVPLTPCKRGHRLRWVASTNCVLCDQETQRRQANRRSEARIEKLYGLSPEAHERLFHEQGRSCAICKVEAAERRDLHIDHCHTTGKVRGLLCSCCNQAIGLLKERSDLMLKAAEYVNA